MRISQSIWMFLLALGWGLLLTTGCNEKAEEKEETSQSPLDETLEEPDAGEISEDILDLFLQIPSPQEAPTLLKNAGANYEEGLLNPQDKVNSYRTETLHALNMGVYTADLSYASVFGKKQVSIKYFKAVKSLAEQLNIEGVFDRKLEKRLEDNQENQDSLNRIFNETFAALNEELKAKRKESALSLIFAGAWIESAYIATEQWRLNPTPEIKKHIANQQSTLQTLITLLETQKSKEGVATIYNQLSAIEPKLSGGKSGYDKFTDENVKEINTQIKKLRAQIVG